MTTERKEQQRAAMQQRLHCDCIACGPEQINGFGLQFRANPDGSVEGAFDCRPFFQGYQGVMHGGVISTVLDAAMTHCLFAQGKSGVTARLIVRFLHPVAVGRPSRIRARLCDCSPPLYVLEAELSQNGKTLAHATAKFIDPE